MKEACAGYGDLFDRLHKSENSSLERRMAHSHDLLSMRQPCISTKYPLSQRLASQRRRPGMRKGVTHGNIESTLVLYRALPPDPEAYATTMFFGIYRKGSTNAFATQLIRLYGSAAMDSPLTPAVATLALGTSMYWLLGRIDVPMVYTYYAKAIRMLRHALEDGNRSLQDDVLMTALVLDLAESLQDYFLPRPPSKSVHRYGAVTLVTHRGQLNHRNEASKSMTATLKDWVVNHAVARGTSANHSACLWERKQELNCPSSELTQLCYRLSEIQNCYKEVIKGWATNKALKADDFVDTALALDKDFVMWRDSLSRIYCPVHLPTANLKQSIREVSAYGSRTSVYSTLAVADMHCKYSLRRLCLLDIVMRFIISSTQTFDSDPTLDSAYSHLREYLPTCMKQLIDGICESLPFYLGDLSAPTNPMLANRVAFPHIANEHGVFPMDPEDHPRQAIASAGVFILYTLTTAIHFIEPERNLYDIPLESGQIGWMHGQITRIKTIFRINVPSSAALLDWCHD